MSGERAIILNNNSFIGRAFMKKINVEFTIFEKAVEAFKQQTGLEIKLDSWRDTGIDAIAFLENKYFDVYVKSSVTKQNFPAVSHELQRGGRQRPTLLVTDYINPNLMDKMREAGVSCIDAAGNAHIHKGRFYIFVKGNKRINVVPEQKTDRAFQYAGLKVIFALLQNYDLVKKTYRDIAEQSDVALGSVGCILKDLAQQGFVRTIGNERRLVDKERLLHRWVEFYPKLKKKHFLGTFTTDMNNWWQTIDIHKFGGYWGGEIAAESYTNYLQAKDAVVFIPERMVGELIKTARLKKSHAKEGVQIELVEPFWQENPLQKQKELAPALLVYADLINSQDSRNFETAQRLYAQYLA